MEQVARLSFQVDGEFITNLSRQWFWDEDKDYEIVEELLLNCLITDDLSLEERKSIAQSIIEGKKKLVGVNEFSLEDDNTKIRPIYDKIRQLKRKAMIKEIEEDIEINPINYVDIYATIYNYEMFTDYMEQYHDGFDHYTYDDVIEYFGKYEKSDLYIPEYENATKAGLWLLEKASLIFDVFGKKVTKSNQNEFFDKLYNYLKVNDTEGYYKNRQKRYERLKGLENLEDFNKESLIKKENKLPNFKEEDYRFGSPEINYYKKPDDLIEEYGWINRYGEWYSCDFGGHECKAQTIVTGNEKIEKDFDAWLKEKGTYEKKTGSYGNGKTYEYGSWSVPLYNSETWKVSGYELYQEYLLQKGWIKFHNPSMGECFPTKYLKPTKEQLDTMFKQSIKRGYKKIQGLDEE